MVKIQVNSQGKAYIANGKALEAQSGGSAPVITSLSVTPTTSAQTITAPIGTDGYSPVNVVAVTSSIDANIQAGNIKKDVQILGVTGTYEGNNGKYKLLDRVKDDSNNEIGTVSGFFTDANNIEYAVVCLDAQYRLAHGIYSTTKTAVTNMPLYNSLVTANMWESKVTATTNTSLILASVSSPACTHCRSKSFLIDGIMYYGQLPNMKELSDIISNYNAIEQLDISASSYSSTNFSTGRSCWSTNQNTAENAFGNTDVGAVSSSSKTSSLFVCPVLEIPNQ